MQKWPVARALVMLRGTSLGMDTSKPYLTDTIHMDHIMRLCRTAANALQQAGGRIIHEYQGEGPPEMLSGCV